jgi:nucleotide-binding universal stress UspA family protein
MKSRTHAARIGTGRKRRKGLKHHGRGSGQDSGQGTGANRRSGSHASDPFSLTKVKRAPVAGLIHRNETGRARMYRRSREKPRIIIMAFKTILTVTGLEASFQDDLKLAADLCERNMSHLSVLVMMLAAPPPIGEYAAVISDSWLRERETDLRHLNARKAEIAAFVTARAVSGDVVSGYPEIAWADEVVGQRARYADLTLAGPALLKAGMLKEKVVEGALFSSGKPLLLVPADSPVTLEPRRVLVAWGTGIEATRAVREALEMLAGAQKVRVAIVDPIEGEKFHGEEPGADVATFLARHGVNVTVDRLPSENHSTADVLRRHAVDTDAQMLVMGAYGHSRVRERVFGGVTRSMLENPPIPVFLAR